MYAREDALLELTDTLLCTQGPVRTLVELCLAAEHRRGHGGMYAALNEGDLEPERLRWAPPRTDPLRTAIYETAPGLVQFSIDQPSSCSTARRGLRGRPRAAT